MSVRTRRALAPLHVQLTGMQPGEEPLVQLMLTEVEVVRESPRVAWARDRRSRRLLRWSLRRARRHGRLPPRRVPPVAMIAYDEPADHAPVSFSDPASRLVPSKFCVTFHIPSGNWKPPTDVGGAG